MSSLWILLDVALAAPLVPTDFDQVAPDLITTEPISIHTGSIGGELPSLTPASGTSVTASTVGVVAASGGREVAVFAFGEVELAHTVTVTGERPLVILSHGDLLVDTTLDLAAEGRVPGPGGYYGGRCEANGGDGFAPLGTSGAGLGAGQPDSNGGGGGGAFGGDGGDADVGAGSALGGTAYGELLAELDGGSGGGAHPDESVFVEDDCPNPTGGGGGGAIELGAGGVLTVAAGALVDVSGAPGQSTNQPSTGGAGGGGAGGGILLHSAAAGSCVGTLRASGGGGGRGRSNDFADGGGGGGGRIVLSGVDDAGCTIERTGGAAEQVGNSAGEPGALGSLVLDDPDRDGDGFTVLSGGDCDDHDPSSHPSAVEVPCDGIDQDCDGLDQADDADGDGFDECVDCDDGDPTVSPDASEIVCDGIDNDCSAATPDEPEDDADGDGFLICDECDDDDPAVFPGASEITCDGIDNDCDPGTLDGEDADGDGFAACADDCDDDDATIHPDADEVPDDGIDQDCDGADASDVDDAEPMERRAQPAPSGCSCGLGHPWGGSPLGLAGIVWLVVRRRARAR